uniref:Dynein-associated protein n=1 Tax=Piliocolobus tephrosceles TaxID=591936 RepID=A0A8C9LHH5_9PRIM
MIDYYYCYTKKQSDIGKACNFTKSKSHVIGRIEPNDELKKKFMHKENIYYNDDNIKKYSEQYVNIESLKLENKFFYHNEGGWAKDIDISDHQNKIKYIKRLDKDINLINTLKTLMNETTKIINKNNSINIYEEYFTNNSNTNSNSSSNSNNNNNINNNNNNANTNDNVNNTNTNMNAIGESKYEENYKIKSLLVIKAKLEKHKKFITSIKWSLDNTYRLAISFCINDHHKIFNNSSKNCLLYNLNQVKDPYQILYSKSFIKCLRFNHKNSDLLLAGSYDGTINLWDLRKKNNICESSLLNISHKSVVFDVIWLQTKTNTQCLSVSNDGLCLVWDIRNFSETIESFYLNKDKDSLDKSEHLDTNTVNSTEQFAYHGNSASIGGSGGDAAAASVVAANTNTAMTYSANCLEWNLEAGPSKILVGTDEGYILSVSKRQAKNLELLQKYGIPNEKHLSSISSIKRIPINLKYFLSTDKWGFNIWSEDIKYPIISNYYNECILNKGFWITNSSFFMLTRKDGYLDIWNLLYNFHEPVIKHKICNGSITEIDTHINNKYLSLGNEQGDVHILKLGDSFCKNSSEEKNALDELFERESKREKNLEYIRKQLNCVKKSDDYLNIQDIKISEDIVEQTEREYASMMQ